MTKFIVAFRNFAIAPKKNPTTTKQSTVLMSTKFSG